VTRISLAGALAILVAAVFGGCPIDVPQNLGYACGDGGACPSGFMCGSAGYCVLPSGTTGGSSGGTSGSTSGTCPASSPDASCIAFADACTTDTDCCQGVCGGDLCCVPKPSGSNGRSDCCSSTAQCCGDLVCQSNHCCIPAGSMDLCQADADCCEGTCYEQKFCIPPTLDGSVPNGQSCIYPTDCKSGDCNNNICCVDVTKACSSNTDCCAGESCSDAGLCCGAQNWGTCTSDSQCCSGSCNFGGHGCN
jgi:hypothetical protein